MYVCVSNSSLKSIAFKVIMVMLQLLVEKFSRISKAKDLGTLERRVDLRKLENLETNEVLLGNNSMKLKINQ